jgi:hypothetical protein
LEIGNGDFELGFLGKCQSRLEPGHQPDGALFIGKPVRPETLIRLLKTLLSQSDPKALRASNSLRPFTDLHIDRICDQTRRETLPSAGEGLGYSELRRIGSH